jgi:hypothetical protein
MFKYGELLFAVVIATAGIAGIGEAAAGPPRPLRAPAKLTPQDTDRITHQKRFQRFNHLSAATRALIRDGHHDAPSRLRNIPSWRGSFTFGGTTFPYTMAGGNPARGDETRLATSMIVLNFKFDEFSDAQGNPLVIDTSQAIVQDVLGSPNFVKSDYTVGHGQFGDVVQKASFFNIAERDWHTTLEKPRMLLPVTIEVPVGQAQVFDAGNGNMIGIVNFDFLFSQLQTILQLEDIRTDELPILISHNVFADAALGFHDAFEVQSGNRSGIQTYTWTSWLDLEAFGPIFADATTITHEISEWIADPFINNATPDWLLPASGGACGNVLEVGDPIEFLDTQMFPITLHGHDYHTQNETMISWFSRDVPSKAFGGGYSYPDITVLSAPSMPCPP